MKNKHTGTPRDIDLIISAQDNKTIKIAGKYMSREVDISISLGKDAEEDAIETHQCGCCDKVFPEDKMYRTVDDELVCEICLEEHYQRCVDCGEIFSNNTILSFPDADGFPVYICEHDLESRKANDNPAWYYGTTNRPWRDDD